MIAGIGLDIVELDRIAKLDAKSAKFRSAYFNEWKKLKFTNRLRGHRRIEFLAGRFAGKEALLKQKEQELERNVTSQISEYYLNRAANQSCISKDVQSLALFLLHIRKQLRQLK